MHVALGNLHLTVALEKRRPDRSAQREPSVQNADVEDVCRRLQLRQEVEAYRERWRTMNLPPGWFH